MLILRCVRWRRTTARTRDPVRRTYVDYCYAHGENVKTIFALLMMLRSRRPPTASWSNASARTARSSTRANCPPGTTEQQTGIKSRPGRTRRSGAAGAATQKSLAERDADFKKRMIEKQEAEQKDAKEAGRSPAEARSLRQAPEPT